MCRTDLWQLHPKYLVEREYVAEVENDIRPAELGAALEAVPGAASHRALEIRRADTGAARFRAFGCAGAESCGASARPRCARRAWNSACSAASAWSHDQNGV